MKVKIDVGMPCNGTYTADKIISETCIGFGKVVDIPKAKFDEIQSVRKAFFTHQQYLRKAYKDIK